MPEVTYIAHDGTRSTLEVETGNSLMMAAVFDGLDGIEGMCGGCLSCASCHVYVDPAWVDKLPPATSDELAMLEQTSSEQRDNSRLSCQIEMTEEIAGIVVTMPETQS
ncbi:MAG: 2Fe-2S iron-sulfur cluster-binding protein [Burkholderiaceae bacterium]